MGPINYLGAMPQIDLAQSLGQGFQLGANIGAISQEAEQRKLAQQRAVQYQTDVAAAMANPSAKVFSALALKYPEKREAFKQAWEQEDEGQRKSQGEAALQTAFALESGNVDAAKKVIQTRITALENSGADASHEKLILGAIDTNPKAVHGELLRWAAFTQDPEKMPENFGKLGQEKRAGDLHEDLVRKGAADAAGAKADATIKTLGVIGQKAGALAQAKDVKPTQVATMFKSLAASGAIPKDELQDYIGSIPQDPKALPAYLNTFKLAGMKPDDQMKYTTPDANTVANNATSRANTRDNNRTQMAVQDRIDARSEAKGNTEPTLDAPTLQSMAEQYVIGGDKTVLQNLGRGAQGAANLVALRGAITRVATENGMSGAQIAAKLADFEGLKAGLRTSANISARVENAIAEARELAPLAIEAGRQVSRSGFLPFGKAQIMFNTQTNDPALKKFAAANVGFVTAYAGAMARGQKPTVHDKEHAEKLISEAVSQEAYEAIMDQLVLEMEAASRAPQKVREHLRGEIGGNGGGHGAAKSSGIPAGWSVKEH